MNLGISHERPSASARHRASVSSSDRARDGVSRRGGAPQQDRRGAGRERAGRTPAESRDDERAEDERHGLQRVRDRGGGGGGTQGSGGGDGAHERGADQQSARGPSPGARSGLQGPAGAGGGGAGGHAARSGRSRSPRAEQRGGAGGAGRAPGSLQARPRRLQHPLPRVPARPHTGGAGAPQGQAARRAFLPGQSRGQRAPPVPVRGNRGRSCAAPRYTRGRAAHTYGRDHRSRARVALRVGEGSGATLHAEHAEGSHPVTARPTGGGVLLPVTEARQRTPRPLLYLH
mmetsp:Transcript_14259/g.37439  ORF Transcript_14259/g.37439 Transcript_14259/m.37439 type:complete len:288 (-) Transcript_14259:147-1010(-)